MAGYEGSGFAISLGFVNRLLGGNGLVATNTQPIPYQRERKGKHGEGKKEKEEGRERRRRRRRRVAIGSYK